MEAGIVCALLAVLSGMTACYHAGKVKGIQVGEEIWKKAFRDQGLLSDDD